MQKFTLSKKGNNFFVKDTGESMNAEKVAAVLKDLISRNLIDKTSKVVSMGKDSFGIKIKGEFTPHQKERVEERLEFKNRKIVGNDFENTLENDLIKAGIAVKHEEPGSYREKIKKKNKIVKGSSYPEESEKDALSKIGACSRDRT